MSDEVQQDVTQEQQTVQLQLSDLLLAAQVIQLTSQRGAIKAEEMTAVGGLYERIVGFLQASGALKPSQAEESDTSAEAA